MPGLDGAWVALAALMLSGATLWNGSRRTTVEMLSKQVETLEKSVTELRMHSARCEQQLAELRMENYTLMKDYISKSLK
jgi:chaperonin cofactor prefoldin